MKQDRSAMEPSPGEQSATAAMPTWDYVSRGLRDPRLKRLFPQMVAGDRSQNTWPYLRSEIPHSWYVDARFPTMGFLSLDEATLLHALALPFAGKPGLEIGCWRGWSTAHLLAAGVVLDVVDPILADEGPREEIRAIARGLGAADRTTLLGAPSPGGVVQAAERRGEPWSFIFIDGDHEAPGPFLDAVAVAPYAADDAMIVFHDLASPHVAAGLDALRDLGWATRVFQTMQIMGVAWRGAAAPVSHHPDGRVAWTIPEHLQALCPLRRGRTGPGRALQARARAPLGAAPGARLRERDGNRDPEPHRRLRHGSGVEEGDGRSAGCAAAAYRPKAGSSSRR